MGQPEDDRGGRARAAASRSTPLAHARPAGTTPPRLDRALLAPQGAALANGDQGGNGAPPATDPQEAEILRRQNEYVAALHETTLGLMNRLEVGDLLQNVVTRAAALVGTEHGYVYLVRPDGEELELEVGIGLFVGFKGYRLRCGQGLAGTVWERGEPILVDDYGAWTGGSPSTPMTKLHAGLALPLISGEKVVGVIGLGLMEAGRRLTDQDVSLLTRFAQLASVALDNAVLYGRLLETETRYRNLVERIPTVTYIDAIDDTASTLYVSPQLEAMTGFSPEEWLADPGLWLKLTHPDDRERVQSAVRRTNTSGERFVQDYRLIARDGRIVWVRDDAVVVKDEAGRAVWQGVLTDITEQHQAEEALRSSEERYRQLVELSPMAIAVHMEGRLVFANQAAATLMGVADPDGLISLPVRDLVHPGGRDPAGGGMRQEVEHGRAFPLIEERFVRLDGRIIDVEVAGIPFVHHGRTGGQIVMRDVTERKRAEEEMARALELERQAAQRLRALDEMKNTFLHAVSHELRTPLSAILGLAVTLRRTEVELTREETQDLLGRLVANARKLDQLLSDLLDLDRMDRGIIEPKRRPTDLAELVRRTLEGSDILGDRPAHIDTESVVVAVEAAKIERIVENLLSNAARHTPAGTTIWIRVAASPGGGLITVEDNGPGVDSALREEVFEPFRQGQQITAHSPGVGVGLSLVLRFAQLHGGRAWVDERPGGGASFKVFLPDPPG